MLYSAVFCFLRAAILASNSASVIVVVEVEAVVEELAAVTLLAVLDLTVAELVLALDAELAAAELSLAEELLLATE
ncbi:MAG: hypothetical protein ABF720_04610, partial [Liquorilactobacillus satsumensis]